MLPYLSPFIHSVSDIRTELWMVSVIPMFFCEMGDSCRISAVFLSSLFLFSCSLSLISTCAANTMKDGDSIRDGEIMLSSGKNFALGFFSPANSTNRYVGIWYNKISLQTPIWIANREHPLTDSSGVLTVGSDGNLMVLDGNRKSFWSTKSLLVSNDSCAILLDSGNLVLSTKQYIGRSDKALWQSFDDPTDTYLPGMRVGWTIRNGNRHLFTSWKSDSDPSKGNFSMGIDPDGSAQIVIWEGSKRHWRSGLWNGQLFTGVPNMRILYLYGFKLSNDEDGRRYFTYIMLNSSSILRFRMRWDGREEQLLWEQEKKEWSHYWSQPIYECEFYNKCGAFGSCNNLTSPICSCLKGFQPKSKDEWNSGNWSSGCERRTELQCQRNSSNAEEVKGDGFMVLDGVKLPDFADWNTAPDRSSCEDECLKNCSCKAYAFVNGIGCLTWAQDLVDIQHFRDGGNKIYIRLADSELGGKSKIFKIVIVIAVILGTIVSSTLVYLFWRYKVKLRGRKQNKDRIILDLSKSREFWTDFSGTDDMGEGNQGNGPELPLFGFNDIATATNNFSNANMLGKGGFGPVYKGTLPCGMEIAVKRLARRSGQGIEEFKTEITLIAKLQHRNLVRLLGCCIEGEEKMLVYEYLPNKSLDAFIFDSKKQVELDWEKRFNIIEGIARGLLYLHRDSRLRIIHRDLKASNILLDKEMNPKISDFGMAKIFGGNQNQANTNRVVGTYGYMSPEYAMEGLFSVKSDVYSFGVLLLEIVSGKKNSHREAAERSSNLLGHAWQLWNEGSAMELIDPSIRDSCSLSDVLRCLNVGLLCVQDSAMDRPTMASVVLMLGSETTSVPSPRQPSFTIARTPIDMELSLVSSEIVSINDVTVTMVVGR